MSARWFLVFLASICVSPADASAQVQGETDSQLIVLQERSGKAPRFNRHNIVFLAEGFTASELVPAAGATQSKFELEARKKFETILKSEPFKAYTTYFNGYAIAVPSADRGSSHLEALPPKHADTYFSTFYGSQGMSRLIGLESTGFKRAFAMLQKWVPEFDVGIVLVNDSAYGGAGGSLVVTSLNPGNDEAMTHELAHNFAKLGDEYSDPYPNYPDSEEPNTQKGHVDSGRISLATLKWKHWLPTTALTGSAPIEERNHFDIGGIGVFEGAHYHPTGWYRPEASCRMRELSRGFCRVCTEAVIKRIYRTLKPIESATAPSVPTTAEELEIKIETLIPASLVQINWYLDDQEILAFRNQPRFQGLDLKDRLTRGDHRVRVRVTDSHPGVPVSSPNRELLTQEKSWVIQIR